MAGKLDFRTGICVVTVLTTCVGYVLRVLKIEVKWEKSTTFNRFKRKLCLER
jgi:hypothetical protein